MLFAFRTTMKSTNLFFTCIAAVISTLLIGCRDEANKPAAVNSLNTFISTVKNERQKAGRDTNIDTANFWYKNGFIYTLDIEVFQDADGTGDIKGLISKLDYIRDLGADAIWLAPFQPTPNEDDGYDISDFYGVDKRLGTMADFDSLVAIAQLAPMLGNNRKRIELAYSMLMALPSTPVLRYGDEIGMGDNLTLKERESVRTPMQWTNTTQGGFSTAVMLAHRY